MINKKIFLILLLVFSSCAVNDKNSYISANQFSPLEQQETKELENKKFFTTLGSIDKEDADKTLDFLDQGNSQGQKLEDKDKQNIWKEKELQNDKPNLTESEPKAIAETSDKINDKTKIIDSGDNFSAQKIDQDSQKIVSDKEKDLPIKQTEKTKIIDYKNDLTTKTDDEKNNREQNINKKVPEKKPIVKYKLINQKSPINQNDQKLNQSKSDSLKQSTENKSATSPEVKMDNSALEPKTLQVDKKVDAETKKDDSEVGLSSWYGKNFNGQKTSNGETYQNGEMTAAHLTLPLNSIVKVTNLENGKSVKVRINDRGPFIKKGSKKRIIDVSEAAAKELGFIEKGTTKVKIEVE